MLFRKERSRGSVLKVYIWTSRNGLPMIAVVLGTKFLFKSIFYLSSDGFPPEMVGVYPLIR